MDRIDASISEAASLDLKRWKMHDDKSADFCELEGKFEEKINLKDK